MSCLLVGVFSQVLILWGNRSSDSSWPIFPWTISDFGVASFIDQGLSFGLQVAFISNTILLCFVANNLGKAERIIQLPSLSNNHTLGVPIVAQWLTNPTMELRVRSLALLSWLGIWRCRGLRCRLQIHLRSRVAVALASGGGYSSH